MFRKLIIASAVLAVSSNMALAGKAGYKGSYKEEPAPCPTYVYQTGPYLGLSVGPVTAVSGTPTAFKGFSGILSAGYGSLWDQFYLAGEIFGGWTGSLKNLEDQATNTYSARYNSSYGISILPGYMITNTVLGYARLSALRTHFNNAPGTSNTTGYQIGLGLQTNVYQNWDLRGEYDYTRYNSVSSSVGRVGTDQVLVGLVYKFV